MFIGNTEPRDLWRAHRSTYIWEGVDVSPEKLTLGCLMALLSWIAPHGDVRKKRPENKNIIKKLPNISQLTGKVNYFCHIFKIDFNSMNEMNIVRRQMVLQDQRSRHINRNHVVLLAEQGRQGTDPSATPL